MFLVVETTERLKTGKRVIERYKNMVKKTKNTLLKSLGNIKRFKKGKNKIQKWCEKKHFIC